jgi:peptidoglycan/xylan/chitin deacetylase (PgdA/CDA1 family)
MAKEILCAIGVHVDAVSGWLGSYGGEDSPADISRGMFAGEVGVPRLLDLFGRFGITTTWFTPGHSAETFPEQMRSVVEAGHEIALHGYSHENPIAMTPDQEEAVLDRSIDVLTSLAGRPPRGYTAPWWEFSQVTNELLLKKGLVYDNSLMHNDFQPYYVRSGDRWTNIDYSKHPDEWMRPLVRGKETDLIEIPANWYSKRRRIATASSIRIIWSRPGATNSIGSTASLTRRFSQSRCIRMSPGDRRCS